MVSVGENSVASVTECMLRERLRGLTFAVAAVSTGPSYVSPRIEPYRTFLSCQATARSGKAGDLLQMPWLICVAVARRASQMAT